MELKFYLAILWRRKWIIIATVLLTTIITAIGSYRLTPIYSATATMWVPASNGSNPVGSGDILLNDRLINTYSELTTSSPVLAELQQLLHVSPAEVRGATSVKSVAQTELMQITVQHADPKLAADIATNLANIVIEQTQKTDVGRNLRVTLFAPAGVPEDPTWLGILSTPLWRQINIVLGFIISLVAGVGLAFLFEYLDTTLYTTEAIETATQLTTLARIPAVGKRQVAVPDNDSPSGEAFRYLRTNIGLDHHDASLRTLLVTSAKSKEGKSTIVANLAVAIAQSGRKVIVVDANLRRPVLHTLFNLSNEAGLSNLLKQEVQLDKALQKSNIAGVQVITSGPTPARPAELLDSPQLAAVIEQLKEKADIVLLDTPAALSATDAAVLAGSVDGVVLVVERSKAHQENVKSAREQLISVGTNLVGVAINQPYIHSFS